MDWLTQSVNVIFKSIKSEEEAKFSVNLAAFLLRTVRKIEKPQENSINTEKPQIAPFSTRLQPNELKVWHSSLFSVLFQMQETPFFYTVWWKLYVGVERSFATSCI
jgi:hypothetical protein